MVWGSWGSESGCTNMVITGPVWCSIGCGAGVDRDSDANAVVVESVLAFFLSFVRNQEETREEERKKRKKETRALI